MGGQTGLRIAVDSSEMNWTISENIFNEKKQIIGAKKLYRVSSKARREFLESISAARGY